MSTGVHGWAAPLDIHYYSYLTLPDIGLEKKGAKSGIHLISINFH
jgi:hypothetical protein